MSTKALDGAAESATTPDAETLALLKDSAAATQKAFRAVIDRKERWVAYSLKSGDLDLGDDDYRTLCAELTARHGEDYIRRFSIIGPLF